MNIQDFDSKLIIRPWKPAIDRVPHLTIETNMTCNFRCKCCYNHNRNRVKTLEEIKEEVDLGLQLRKSNTITLLGGEPSIHPDLPEIISYIKTKGVVIQMLTNGFIYLSDPFDSKLKQLKENGLDRVLLHIDEGQEKYENPVKFIHQFLKKAERLKILTSVSWTIYNEYQRSLPELIIEFSSYRCFDGFLCTIERSVDIAIQPESLNTEWPRVSDVYQTLKDSLNLQPAVYLPTNLRDESISWLIYFYYVNSITNKTFSLSPLLTRVYQKLYLRIKKQELFGIPPIQYFFGMTLLFTGILEIIIKPARINEFLQLLKGSKWMSLLRYQMLCIQDGPQYDAEFGCISMCYHCPDATVRNGRLSPVCLADWISPHPGDEPPDNVPANLASTVFEHLRQ